MYNQEYMRGSNGAFNRFYVDGMEFTSPLMARAFENDRMFRKDVITKEEDEFFNMIELTEDDIANMEKELVL